MAKSTRTLSGQSQRKFFRELLRADPGVTADAAARLTEQCADEIANIRVRLPLAVRRPVQPSGPSPTPLVAPSPATAAVDPATSFDPHAFSLIVVLRKAGRDGLLTRLATVGGIDQLRAMAIAQHVALDPAIEDRGLVEAAILAGTEQRVAHRQAAAS